MSEAKDFSKQYACSGWKVTSPGGTLSLADLTRLHENLVAAISRDKSTTTTTTTSTDGTVTTYEPGKNIVVRRVGVTDPVSYVLGKTVRFVNAEGKEIEASKIKPGTRVHVYYDGTGETRVVNRVVVEE
jgi:multidrug resistance efflux pump